MLRRISIPLCVLVCACPKPEVAKTTDAGSPSIVTVDGGARVTTEKLDAWLRWQDAVFALPLRDGGSDVRQRAKDEARLLLEVGLRSDDADAIEAVVAAVVAERNVAKISGSEALEAFKDGLKALPTDQRAKAEAALNEVPAKSQNDGLRDVEREFGTAAVSVVLEREADVIRAWERVLEAQAGR